MDKPKNIVNSDLVHDFATSKEEKNRFDTENQAGFYP